MTVRHAIPGDSRRLLTAARGTAPVFSEAETAKHTRYPATVGTLGPFFTFVVETFGALGKDVHSLLLQVVKTMAQRSSMDSYVFASFLIGRWAARLAVARAHARAVSSSLGSAGALFNLSQDAISDFRH